MALLKGDNKDNILTGGNLTDTLVGYGGDDVLVGGAGDDILKGGAGNDVLVGGAGNDFLYGDSGADVMVGGAGDDVYKVDNGGDVVTELAGGGTDTVRASISWTLAANVENLVLTGHTAIDGVGNDLNNTIKGNNANNWIDGGAGDDFIDGGLGIDTLHGGLGNDTFKIYGFNAFSGESIDGGAGMDVLQNVAENQVFDLTSIDTLSGLSNIEGIRLGATHSTVIANADSIIQLSDTNTLKIDASDGSNTVIIDEGWVDQGIINGYHTLTKDYGYDYATLQINPLITDIKQPVAYTISDAASAANVGSVFDSGEQVITLDFGSKQYSDWGLSTIDLSGFGLEDKLVISTKDGAVTNGSAAYFYYGYSRSIYIHEITFFSPLHSATDRVSWQVGASQAKLFSYQRTSFTNWVKHTYATSYGGTYMYSSPLRSSTHHSGVVALTGLPKGLPDSQFVFV